jgi:hypothetical protein
VIANIQQTVPENSDPDQHFSRNPAGISVVRRPEAEKSTIF